MKRAMEESWADFHPPTLEETQKDDPIRTALNLSAAISCGDQEVFDAHERCYDGRGHLAGDLNR